MGFFCCPYQSFGVHLFYTLFFAPVMRRALLLIGILLVSAAGSFTFGQTAEVQDTLGDNILFRKEKSGSGIFHSAGWGLGYRFGINQNYFHKRMFEFDIVEMKSPREVKRANPNFSNSRRYVYGKLNNVYLMRFGYGAQKLLNDKPYWGGIEVRFFYYGGVEVGLAKPVYLLIANYTKVGEQIFYDITTEKYDPQVHFPYRVIGPTRDVDIYGRAPLYKGLGEIKPYPGMYTKVGFNFEYGTFNQSLRAIEVGATLDAFPKAIPIMAFNKPYHFFVNIYLSFSFGKRYN
jgi:hypothetical protein